MQLRKDDERMAGLVDRPSMRLLRCLTPESRLLFTQYNASYYSEQHCHYSNENDGIHPIGMLTGIW
jgi:hypothetical protein